MFFVRQNATHKLVIGPVVAVANGYVPVTTLDLTTADEKCAVLHDNGTVVSISAYTFAAITSADGYYHLTLQSGITGTVGHVTIVINDDSLCLPVKAEYTVVEEAVYDAMYAASAIGYVANAPVNVAQWNGSNVATPSVAGVPEVDITHFNGTAGTFASGRPEVNASHFAGTAYATALAAEVDAVWDEVITGAAHNTPNSAGRRLRLIDAAFEVHAGTAQAGSTATTFVMDTGASAVNDIYNGDRIVIIAGTGAEEHGLISAYVGATRTATMSKSWVVTPDATSEFAVLPADCDVESWNNTAVTGDGDWSELQTDVDAILVDTGTTLDGRIPAALTADGNMKADTLRVGGTLQTAGDLAALVTTVDTVVDAIKVKTDSLTFTKALELDTNIQSVNGVTVNGDGAGTPMGV